MSERNRIIERSEPYDDNRQYDAPGHVCASSTRERAIEAAETLIALVAARKLDSVDLQIIEERSRSPMPSLREVAAAVGLSVATIHERTKRIKALVASKIGPKKGKRPNIRA